MNYEGSEIDGGNVTIIDHRPTHGTARKRHEQSQDSKSTIKVKQPALEMIDLDQAPFSSFDLPLYLLVSSANSCRQFYPEMDPNSDGNPDFFFKVNSD